MRFLRHLVVGLALLVAVVIAALAFSLYDPLSGGRHFLSRSQLIVSSQTRDDAHLITGEAPIQATDPPQLAALALHYQPTVVVSAEDGFGPVAVLDALRLQFDGHETCLYRGGHCQVRGPLPSQLPGPSSKSDYLS